MAIMAVFSGTDMTPESYDQVMRDLDAAGAGAPEGRLWHTASFAFEGFTVVDIWETPEQIERFAATLVPILERNGIAMPVPVIAEVRNTLTGSPTMEIGSDVEGQALQRAVDAFNAGDLSTYLRLYDMSCVFHGYGPEDLDLDGARAFYTGVLGAFPDAWLDLDDIVRDGEKACIRFHLTATQQGEFMGVPPTGRPIRLEGQTIMCFRNGRVVERWQSADMLSLMVQLGAVPAPA